MISWRSKANLKQRFAFFFYSHVNAVRKIWLCHYYCFLLSIFWDNSSFTWLTLMLEEDETISRYFTVNFAHLFFIHHRSLRHDHFFRLDYKTIVSLSSSNIPFNEVRYLMDCLSRHQILSTILQVKQCQPLQKTFRLEHLY